LRHDAGAVDTGSHRAVDAAGLVHHISTDASVDAAANMAVIVAHAGSNSPSPHCGHLAVADAVPRTTADATADSRFNGESVP
jgi:hypothetical protein